MNYIIVIAATILLAFDFALSKKYQGFEGTSLTAGLKFNALNGLATALVFFALSGFKAEFSFFSVILAFFMAFFATAYSIIGFRILKAGNMAIYSIFLMSCGMLLPYLFGALFLDEALTFARIGGVIIILAAVILSNNGKHSFKASLFLPCIIVFVLNGAVSIISKCHQINTTFHPVSSMTFVMYSGICKCVLSTLALLVCKKERVPSFSSGKPVLIVLCSALIGGVSYMLQLNGAKELPATVLYPIVTGGSIIFSALSGRVFFKEKISTYQLLSIILCFIGTLLFL